MKTKSIYFGKKNKRKATTKRRKVREKKNNVTFQLNKCA